MRASSFGSGSKKPGHFHYKKGVQRTSHKLRNTAGIFVAFALVGGLIKADAMSVFASSARNHQAVETVEAAPNPQATDSSIPVATSLPKQDTALESSINQVIKEFPKEQQWSVYVQDLSTQRAANVHADEVYDAASLAKLFLLAPLESKTPSDKWSYYRIGSTNVGTCVDAMLRVSDNDCAKSIGAMVNWNYVDQFNRSLGYSKTTLTGTPKTTAAEVGDLLVNLKKGKMLSDKARRTVFDSLYAQKFTEGLPSGCSNCRTANKTGQTDTVTHDAGIVTHGQRSYVIVVMSKGGSFAQIAQITKAVETELNP